MTYTRRNKGVCSTSTTVTLDASGCIESVHVEDGCDGNLQGVCALLRGMPAQEGIRRLQGIQCEGSDNSCPRQISLCLQEALNVLHSEAC